MTSCILEAEYVEQAAYFVASEALANVNKHSGASRAELGAAVDGALLRLWVSDDGVGGASLSKGHGLTGLAQRLEGVDGQLSVISPVGGPTTVQAVIPVRVLIADDSVLLRQGLALILAEGGLLCYDT